MNDHSHPPASRKWKFTLRALIVCVTACCVFLGWFANRANRQQRASARLQELGATVVYDFDSEVGGNDVLPAPEWLIEIFGIDYFANVVSVWIPKCDNDSFACVAGLIHLETMTLLDRDVVDHSPLANLPKLRSLTLFNSKVVELGPLAELESLRYLSLCNTQISDLSPLANQTAKNLDQLFLFSNAAQDVSGVFQLQGLKELRLYQQKQPLDLALLGNLTGLEKLWVEAIDVGDLKWTEGLDDLKWLTIRKSTITDLTPLYSLVNLKTLEIGRRDTGVSRTDISALQQALPNCRVSHAW